MEDYLYLYDITGEIVDDEDDLSPMDLSYGAEPTEEELLEDDKYSNSGYAI